MKIEELVLKNYADLNSTDLFIWKYISSNKKISAHLGIDELAKHCNVSRTTITRFVRKIGLNGFSEFKVLLNWENDADQLVSLDESDYELACNAIVKYVENQKEKDYTQICKLLYESRQTFAYGSGDIQNAVTKQMKRFFLSCQEIIYDFGGVTFDHAFYNLVDENDVMILVSLSGNSKEILEIAQKLKTKGVKIISITEFRNNQLTSLSDASLYITSTNLTILAAHPTFQTTMLYFILVELLFIKYSIYKRQRMLAEGKEMFL